MIAVGAVLEIGDFASSWLRSPGIFAVVDLLGAIDGRVVGAGLFADFLGSRLTGRSERTFNFNWPYSPGCQ